MIGATRAPAFSPGIRAGTKRGQMTCGPRDSLDQEPDLGTGVISDRIRACDAYAPEQPGNSAEERGAQRSLPGKVADQLWRLEPEAGKP